MAQKKKKTIKVERTKKTYIEKASAAVSKKLVSAGRRASIFGELWDFLKVRKKWWLGPPLVILLLLAVLLVFAESSAVAPFIYTLF